MQTKVKVDATGCSNESENKEEKSEKQMQTGTKYLRIKKLSKKKK